MEIANVSSVIRRSEAFLHPTKALQGGYQVAYLLAAYFKPPNG
jgi:hypothetical protein